MDCSPSTRVAEFVQSLWSSDCSKNDATVSESGVQGLLQPTPAHGMGSAEGNSKREDETQCGACSFDILDLIGERHLPIPRLSSFLHEDLSLLTGLG